MFLETSVSHILLRFVGTTGLPKYSNTSSNTYTHTGTLSLSLSDYNNNITTKYSFVFLTTRLYGETRPFNIVFGSFADL